MNKLNEQLGKTRRKSREEIRKRELIRRNDITDPDILAALAEELGYRARRTRWTKEEMKRMRGMGGFAKTLSKLKTRNKPPSEELIAELGYRRVRARSRRWRRSSRSSPRPPHRPSRSSTS